MNIKEMHYDFKKKLNKGDSQQYRNFLIPEIDWVLNEAAELMVKLVAQPRLRSQLGFELNQRSIDDIRTLVVSSTLSVDDNTAALPADYWFYVRSYANITKGNCSGYKARVHVRQYDDEFEESPFDSTSFEWRIVNTVFNSEGLKFFATDFYIENLELTYVKRLAYMHNAEDFGANGYTMPSGVTLTGTQDCELPEQTHREIVDLAVLIASGEIQSADYNIKQDKVVLNNLK